MTVRAERGPARVWNPGQNRREERADLVRDGKANRVRKVDRRTTSSDDGLDDPAEKLQIASRASSVEN
jgi:hypothetical protein